MRYLPLTDAERDEMRRAIGIRRTEELFACVADGTCTAPQVDLPPALAETELIRRFEQYADRNRFGEYLSFLGAGAYRHFIPEVVENLSAKGEFVTPYTPYQPEVSQGSLQAMFEYQTLIAMLTGLDVANASLYDGGTAAAEAALLAVRKSGKTRLLLAASLHPEYREIIRTYAQNLGYQFVEVAAREADGQVDEADLNKKLNDRTAAFIYQSPNFFGVVESGRALCEAAHAAGAYAVQVVAEAMSLPFLSAPGAAGADIAAGEAQSFGLPLGFGGPYLGFMAAREEFLRQMPGRIVGQTKDLDGRRGYVLTLSTREQHIKREKATSNICTNQAWCAVRAAMYLATMGKSGLEAVARQNHLAAAYFVRAVARCGNVRVLYPAGFFNEVVLRCEKGSAESLLKRLRRKKILAGIPLKWFYRGRGKDLLLCFTEMHSREEIDRLVTAIGDSA